MKPLSLTFALVAALAWPALLPARSTAAPPVHADATETQRKTVAGSITARTETELTVKNRTGDTTVVLLTATTRYLKDDAPAKATDLRIGDYVRVALRTNAEGRTEAETVTLTAGPKPTESRRSVPITGSPTAPGN